jgi:hypothetical protein
VRRRPGPLLAAAAALLGLVAGWSLVVFGYALVNVVILGHGSSGARHGRSGLWIVLVLLAANAVLFGVAATVVARRARAGETP